MEAMDEVTRVGEGGVGRGGEENEGEDSMSISSNSDDSDSDGENINIMFQRELFNGQIWNQIKSNDPNCKSVQVSWGGSYYANWENEGRYLGTNTNLKRLTITSHRVEFQFMRDEYEYNTEEKKDIIDFCKGLANNESIEHLCFSRYKFHADNMFAHLLPFFHNNSSLRWIEIQNCKMTGEGVSMLSSAISNCNRSGGSLKQVDIHHNYIRDESDLADLTSAMKAQTSITRLSFSSNIFDRNGFGVVGCSALGNLLQNPSCNITSLNLSEIKVNDEGLIALSQILLKNNSLKKLYLSNNLSITATGWEALSTVLNSPKTSLKLLDLSCDPIPAPYDFWRANNLRIGVDDQGANDLGGGIDDQGANALANTLGNNTSLRSLNLNSNTNIGTLGWRAFSSALSNPNSALKKLYLNSNNIDDEGIAALAGGLENNKTLTHLSLSKNVEISPGGWRVLFNSLQNSNCAIEKIDLEENNIGYDGAVALATSLGSLRSLKILNLDSIEDNVTHEGWQAISNHLQSANCVLREIYLTGIAFQPEDIDAFANALVHNRSLHVLLLHGYIFEIAREFDVTFRWSAFSNALCDKSSIDATYSSNHSLQELFDDDLKESDIPDDLSFLLQVNRNNTKADAIRQKILHYHFLNDGINVEEIIGMDLKALPTAISWIGRDDVGFPILYRLFQSLPFLLDANKKMGLGLKRKRPDDDDGPIPPPKAPQLPDADTQQAPA